MGKATNAKCRLCKREGIKLFLKGERCESPKCPIERKGAVPPGQHGAARHRRPSDYALQLREKQRVKRLYGIRERQSQKYFKIASHKKGDTEENLLQLFETRLDNVLYRLGFCHAKELARQLISHGHVKVNGKKLDVPSYNAKAGDVISLSAKAMELPGVKENLAKKKETLPAWLSKKGPVGKVERLPKRDDMDSSLEAKLIVEYYSR